MEKATLEHLNTLTAKEQDICKKVTDYFGISLDFFFEESRKNRNSIPRYIAMYLMKNLIKNVTLGYIGTRVRIKKLHHTSVLHGIEMAKIEMQHNEDIQKFVNDYIGENAVEIKNTKQYNIYKNKNFKIIAYAS